MLLKSQTPAVATTPSNPYTQYWSSGEPDFSKTILNNQRGSLAVSPDQARLQKSLFDFACGFITQTASTALLSTDFVEGLFPALVDKSCFEAEHRETRQLEIRLDMAFEETPLEDGFNHPAELIIDQALRSMDRDRILNTLASLAVDNKRPEFAASVLRCLGRLRPGTTAWRVGIVRTTLASDNIEMRDAAAKAAEEWGDTDVRVVLKNHIEPVWWLRDYITQIIDDISA